jgi:hypothetical protein
MGDGRPIFQDFGGGNAEDLKAESFQGCISSRVLDGSLLVDGAVNLNDQFCLRAVKVGDE